MELLPGDAEPPLCRGALTCIAEPYLRPGAHLGRGVGGGRRGRGQSSLAGRGAGRRAALRMRASPRLGAREPGPPGWLAWEWGALVGAVPHPGPVPSRRDLFTPRPAAAAAAAGGGGGQPLGPAAPRPIGAQHANEGARHTAAGAVRAAPPPLRLGRPEMRLPPAVRPPPGRPSGPTRPGRPAGPRASGRGTYLRYLTCAGLGGALCPDARPRGRHSHPHLRCPPPGPPCSPAAAPRQRLLLSSSCRGCPPARGRGGLAVVRASGPGPCTGTASECRS